MKKETASALQALLRDFYNLTGIKTCLFDADGNELFYYPPMHSRFCALLREDREMDARCKKCDKDGFDLCRKTRTQHTYICHAGLRECISPILFENRIVGFIMIGQICEASTPSKESAALIASVGQPLAEAYGELSSIPAEKLSSAFRILDACAGYELLRAVSSFNVPRIDRELEKIVQENLSGALSVPFLCSRLHLSHNEIYTVCKEYFASTPAEYIKSSRLAHAKQLLRESDLPISEIAVRCGIPDYNYFPKIFKSAFSESPTAYRRRHRTKE